MTGKNIRIFFLYLQAAMLVFLASCKTPGVQSVPKKTLTENQRSELMFNFHNALKEKMLGNLEASEQLLQLCLKTDDSNDAVLYELAQIYYRWGKYSTAQYYAKRASQISPKNEWYLLLLSEIYQKNKQYDDAIHVMEQLIKLYPSRVDFHTKLANAYLYAGKITEAIKAYDRLENKIGVSPEVSLQKQKLYMRLGKIDKAILEIEKLVKSYPREAQYYGLLAELYQSSGQKEKALEIFKKVEEFDPENPYLHLSLADFYRSSGQKEKSFAELKIAFASKRLDLETKISILTSYYLLISRYPELKQQADELLGILVDTHPSESRSYAVYGDFLYQDGKLEKAREMYRTALEYGRDNFLVWQQILLIDSDLQDYDALENESEQALALFPTQPIAYLLNGMAKTQLKKYEEAITILNSGMILVVDNNALLSQFYSSIGDVYNKMKRHRDSDLSFEKALELEPKNSYLLNNYGYYLSLRSDSLEKAEKMSALSNEIEPNNASFQDTYAWILYKIGNYQGAKEWLEKAMENGGDKNAVILEHYGDALWKLGETENAIKYWRKAKDAGQGSEFLEKKIDEKKLVE